MEKNMEPKQGAQAWEAHTSDTLPHSSNRELARVGIGLLRNEAYQTKMQIRLLMSQATILCSHPGMLDILSTHTSLARIRNILLATNTALGLFTEEIDDMVIGLDMAEDILLGGTEDGEDK